MLNGCRWVGMCAVSGVGSVIVPVRVGRQVTHGRHGRPLQPRLQRCELLVQAEGCAVEAAATGVIVVRRVVPPREVSVAARHAAAALRARERRARRQAHKFLAAGVVPQ